MSTKQLIVGASGIYIAYLYSSIIYQKLYNHDYPSISRIGQTDKFQHAGLCVWIGALFCAIFGFLKGIIIKQRSNPIVMKQQVILGVLYTINIFAANLSLVYITYLAQTIGRNCRYLLVVIVGAFFSRVKKDAFLKIKPKKLYVAILITIGVIMFTLMKNNKNEQKQVFNFINQWKGYILVLISIVADALFSDSQAYSKVNFKPTANHLFTSANFFTFLFVFLFGVIQGAIFEQIFFCVDHPEVILDIILAGVLQVLGQISIYYIIANFKQHIFPLISTTRKILTVLLSIIIYKHSVNIWQWISIFLIFGGLIYELQEQIRTKKKQQ